MPHEPVGAAKTRALPGDVVDVLCAEGEPGERADQAHRLAVLTRGMSVGEVSLLDSGPRSASVRAVTDARVLVLPLDRIEQLSDGRFQLRDLRSLNGTFIRGERVTSDHILNDGDEFTMGSTRIVFVDKPAKVAFVGDVLFRGSIGRTDFPRGNHEQLLSSIRQRLWPLGDDITFVPGHGQTSTFGWERKTNPFVADLNFDDEEEASA